LLESPEQPVPPECPLEIRGKLDSGETCGMGFA
jgi:hypothetical protein